MSLDDDDDRRLGASGDPGHSPADEPSWLRALPMPDDARRLGLDRNTEEGALVAMVAGLDPANPWHRLVAWVLLVLFAGPVLMAVLPTLWDVLTGL